jgi:hypothetical protein
VSLLSSLQGRQKCAQAGEALCLREIRVTMGECESRYRGNTMGRNGGCRRNVDGTEMEYTDEDAGRDGWTQL